MKTAIALTICLMAVWALAGCQTTTKAPDGTIITSYDVNTSVAILQAAIAEADHVYQLVQQSQAATAEQKAAAQAARDAKQQQYLALIAEALKGRQAAATK